MKNKTTESFYNALKEKENKIKMPLFYSFAVLKNSMGEDHKGMRFGSSDEYNTHKYDLYDLYKPIQIPWLITINKNEK